MTEKKTPQAKNIPHFFKSKNNNYKLIALIFDTFYKMKTWLVRQKSYYLMQFKIFGKDKRIDYMRVLLMCELRKWQF